MGMFVCDLCHTLENTACGWYHCRNSNARMLGPNYPNGQCLCSACTPEKFQDGTSTKFGGRWHRRFKREKATEEYINNRINDYNLKYTKGLQDVLKGISPTVIL